MGTGFRRTLFDRTSQPADRAANCSWRCNCTAGNLTTRGRGANANVSFHSDASQEKTMIFTARVYNGPRFHGSTAKHFRYERQAIAWSRIGATAAVCKESHEECARTVLEVPGWGRHPALERKNLL